MTTPAVEFARSETRLAERPRLVFFHSRNSGRSRRVEGYLSQVLQRRRNHESFLLHNVDVDEKPELAEHFRISEVPTLVVVEGKRVRARLDSPRGCRAIEQLLAPWLR
jgi:thioredoxin-like negative regulator of GroEL